MPPLANIVLKAWPPLSGEELSFEFRGRPSPGLGRNKPVAKGQALARVGDPLAGDVVSPSDGVVLSVSPAKIVMRAGKSAGGRPPERLRLSSLHGEALGEALKRLGAPRPLPPLPGEPALLPSFDPEDGLRTAKALRNDMAPVLKDGAALLQRLWPRAEIAEVLAPGDQPLGAGRIITAKLPYPFTSPKFLKLALFGAHDPAGHGVVPAEILWALGAAARTGLPLDRLPITLQSNPYLAPQGLKIEDVLERLNLAIAGECCLILGGALSGAATARVSRGLDWSMGAARLSSRASLSPPGPCLRCGACRNACPLSLPMDLLGRLPLERWPHLQEAAGALLSGCLACGHCAFRCPSSRPLQALALLAQPRGGPPFALAQGPPFPLSQGPPPSPPQGPPANRPS
jgi:ferredoxin